jgi:hypothetical protein
MHCHSRSGDYEMRKLFWPYSISDLIISDYPENLKERNFIHIMKQFNNPDIIAGAIAIIITITICYSFIANPLVDIPSIFSNALTVILGFYFGTKVAVKKEK